MIKNGKTALLIDGARRVGKSYIVKKFAAGYEEKVYAVFDGIPGQLSKKEKKYTLSSIDKNARFRNYEDSFIWLNEAMIVNICYNSTAPAVGLALSSEHSTQKCYMADTGLLTTLIFMDSSYTDNLNRENHMEIDFLITKNKKISPVEVKSANYRSHSSLDKFRRKFSSRLGESYILYTGDIMKKDDIWHLPLYMAMFL